MKDFGASGNGISDDRAAIQSAIDEAVAHNKGGIFFPAGTYRVSRVTTPGGRWSLDLNGARDFVVMGEGSKSVVKLMNTSAATGDWHVFILRNDCRRVMFSDLVIDGNRLGLTSPDEQSHGIEVEGGTEDLLIDRCILRDCFGDGVRLLGTAATGKNVRRVRITNCLFQANKRSGLGIQRALEQIVVCHCMFDATVSDQDIDFEPSGADAPTDLLIQGCIINHTNASVAVSLSGIGGVGPLLRCKFTDNIVLGGPVFCTDVDQLTVQNNVVVVPDVGNKNRVPLQVQRGGESLLISGNLLVNECAATEAVLSLSEVNQRQVSRALVAGNLCITRAGRGIQCLSGDDVAIQGNMVVATGACTAGVFVRCESSGVDGMSVRDNDVTVKGDGGWQTGIRFAASAPNAIGHVSVTGNSVKGAVEGIVFGGPNYTQTPACALNRIDSGVASPLVGIANLPEDAFVVGGATSSGGATAGSGAGRFIAGLGDPNAKVAGNVGDIFQRLDGVPGASFYVKESGNADSSGWVSK